MPQGWVVPGYSLELVEQGAGYLCTPRGDKIIFSRSDLFKATLARTEGIGRPVQLASRKILGKPGCAGFKFGLRDHGSEVQKPGGQTFLETPFGQGKRETSLCKPGVGRPIGGWNTAKVEKIYAARGEARTHKDCWPGKRREPTLCKIGRENRVVY